MKQLDPSSLHSAREVAQTRFARAVVACLNEDTARLHGDISERLRFARENALARVPRTAAAASRVGVSSGGAAMLGRSFGSAWLKVASFVPLLALIGGLVLIQKVQTQTQISTAAEVDAALLADVLPPTAYRDAGFVEFLKTPPRE